jgi:6-phosphogluconolactonase
MPNNNYLVFENIQCLSRRVSEDILSLAKKAIALNGRFLIVLTGGSSYIEVYKILQKSKADWKNWHLFLSDERCLPIGHLERNDYMIDKAWLNNSSIPKKNIYFTKIDICTCQGIKQYEKQLTSTGLFDLALLSIGEDGHTASLFPDRIYDKERSVVTEINSPKYPKKRVSLSYERLNNTKQIIKVICGNSKKKAFFNWENGKNTPFSKVTGYFESVYVCEGAIHADCKIEETNG